MKITICGSIEFTPKILEVKSELEKLGHSVAIPLFSQKIAQGELSFHEFKNKKELDGGDINIRNSQKEDLIKRYWDLIKSSDAILVINMEKRGIKNYIGGSVLMEMGFAYGQNKKIFLYNPLPEKSERIHYLDEIIDMDPVIINSDLTMIK